MKKIFYKLQILYYDRIDKIDVNKKSESKM